MEQLLNLLEKVNDDSVKGQAFNVFKEIATKLMSEYNPAKNMDTKAINVYNNWTPAIFRAKVDCSK